MVVRVLHLLFQEQLPLTVAAELVVTLTMPVLPE
jgi:hypothetical protein